MDRADLSVNYFDSNNEVIVGAEACGKYSEGSNPPLVATEFQGTITAGPVAQVSLFASALGAAIVDPAAAIVTNDPGEWADALEQSLHLEKEMGALRR